jgi:hypothetical protein
VTATSDSGDDSQLSEDKFVVSSKDYVAIMEQMITYVGHVGTYDQQDEIDGVKTIEFSTTLQDFLDHLDVTLSKVFGQAIYYWKG